MREELSRPLTFYTKQILFSLTTHFVSMAFLAFVIFQLFEKEYHSELKDALSTKSMLVSSAVSSSIMFEDVGSASALLQAAVQGSEIQYAQIYLENGTLFSEAKNHIDLDTVSSSELDYGDPREIGNSVYYKSKIDFNGKALGYIIISGNNKRFEDQKNRLYYVLIGVFLFTSVIVFLVTFRAQRYLEKPIKSLVELVGYVQKHDKYDKRVEIDRDDDIGDLIDGVNQMLNTIQNQREDAQKHAVELESLVELRTEQLFLRANYDSLTRLPNRHSLAEFLNNAIESAKRSEERFAVLFLDLDRFKVINDTLGHAVGDKLLKSVAHKLSSVLRKSDCVSRWGGDEFVIVLKHILSEEQVFSICKKIIDVVKQPTIIDEHQLHVSTSVGIAIYPHHGSSRSDLLKNADASMYDAKNKGPSRYSIFEQSMLDATQEKMSIEARVRRAIEQEEFDIVYQLQVCAVSGKICGLEALARWQADGQYISPAKFIPAIEETGLMVNFTRWVVKEVCSKIREFNQCSPDIESIAVNVPASVLAMPDCAQMILSEIERNQIKASQLEIEITESTFVDRSSHIMENLHALRSKHMKVAVDDFGKGYSCLSYLKDLPITTLKIDGSFVDMINRDEVSSGIIKAIVVMAKTLNLKLTAECVETQEQMRFLRGTGVDYFQGYLFSEPLAFEGIISYLQGGRVFSVNESDLQLRGGRC